MHVIISHCSYWFSISHFHYYIGLTFLPPHLLLSLPLSCQCPGVFNSPFRPTPHEMEQLLRQVKYQAPTRLAPRGRACLLGMPGPEAPSFTGTLESPWMKNTRISCSSRLILPPIASKKQQVRWLKRHHTTWTIRWEKTESNRTCAKGERAYAFYKCLILLIRGSQHPLLVPLEMRLDESRDPLKLLLKKNDIIKTWQTALLGATAQSSLMPVPQWVLYVWLCGYRILSHVSVPRCVCIPCPLFICVPHYSVWLVQPVWCDRHTKDLYLKV